MSDFTSNFWHFYVAGLTLASILACALLLYKLGKMKVAPAPKGAKDGGVGTTGHVWDEDLAEYNNPLPRWWMWLFYITIVFGLVYLVLYPGFGKAPGILGWTSSGAYQAEVKDFNAQVAPLFAKYTTMDIKQVAADPQARAMGERLFLTYCSQCHGSDAGGARGFPNLRDTDWLYGGEPEMIQASITNGRNGIMPAWAAVLGDEGVKNVVNYVRSLSGLPVDSLRAQTGKPLYMTNCVACHGPDGKGNQLLGAPNLTDQIWRWGGSVQAVTETIVKGHGTPSTISRMPAHKDLLDPEKIRMLTAYVWGLSNVKQAGAQ